MTDEELYRILSDLTGHLKAMRDDRRTSGLNAPSGSGNGGKPPKHGKSKLPCSADLLDWEHKLAPLLSEPAEELAAAFPGQCWRTPRQDPSRGTDSVAWAQWLSHPRHRPLILQMPDWYFLDTLREVEEELRYMLHPMDPNGDLQGLPTFATAAQLADHFHIAEKTIKRWCDRNQITHWPGADGRNIYPTSAVLAKRTPTEEGT
ncbi:hypothetical protein [Corynebacterium glyciniphilum]|uniref:hypothetical protein n=1 Tax=Corynebacterium glyciniphilum TaxID=1404244 RepID=UPI00264C1103|nr:hypothetical protein [Corynebacterium glyciniphilum]MDN6706398.1 hypothetical protein [Corynebacterium glyciniphilum]